MKGIFSLTIFLNLILICAAQNLVPNHSFENYFGCPKGFNSMDTSDFFFPTVDKWYNPNLGTADYFNICGDELDSVPNNFDGFQFPHTGNAYGGIICYTSDVADYREYLQVKLDDVMEAGRIYCVQFYVSNSGGKLFDKVSGEWVFQSYAISSLGAYFSPKRITNFVPGGTQLNVIPQLQNDQNNFLSDTTNWTLVSGLYFAKGGEQYLTLGNFRNDASTQKKLIVAGNGHEPYGLAYYYFDDVYVVPTDIIFKHIGNDTTLCDGDSLMLNITNPLATGYLWQDGNISPVYTIHGEGEYLAKVSFGDCGAISDSIHVNYFSPPNIFLGNDTSICAPNSLNLAATADGNAQFHWQDGSTDNHFSASTSGEYWLQASNECGDGADTIHLEFVNCNCRPVVPNAFTPNGDGINDIMKPVMECDELLGYDFKILNRWGELMFETTDVNEGWNGNYKNQAASLGTYIYVIAYSGNTEGREVSKVQSGNFVLLR